MRLSRRGRIIAGVAAALVVSIVALSFGPIVRSKLESRAAKRGLVVTAGHVSPGWLAVTVSDVHVALEGTDAVGVELPEMRVELSALLSPESITSHSSHVTLHGSDAELIDAIRAWRDRRPPADPNATGSKHVDVTFDGMSIDWDDRANATGVSFVRDAAGSHVTVDHASAKIGEISVDFGSAKIDADDRGLLHTADAVTADVTWTTQAPTPKSPADAQAAASSSSEPAPPPLPASAVAKKKNGAEKEKKPSMPAFGAAAPIALPDLHASKEKLGRAVHALADRLADDAEASIENVSIHRVVVGSDKPALTLGPAKVSVRRHDAVLDATFATTSNAAGARLSLDGQLPIDHGDVRVAFQGGPITLADLGAQEGAGGLVDVAAATVTAKGSAILKDDASALTFDGEFGVDRLGISQPKIADDVVHGLQASMLLKGSYDDEGVLTIDDAQGAVGALRLRFRGTVTDAHDHVEGALAFDAPTAACQSLLDSIPAALVPDVRGMDLAGTFGASGKVAFDTRDLDELELSYVIDDKCKFEHVPEDFDRERFTHPFQHIVYLPDGSTAEEETGPGSDAWVDLEHVSPYMQVAVLTTEDGAFYKHHGFNHAAIRQSIIANLKAGKFVRGASTISMQLTKNLFLTREKTVARKLEEVILTDYLEQTFTKREIMELYLNVIEFGPDVYGIAAGAEHYFGRKADELNLAESLFMSSLLPNPIGYHKLWEKGQISPSWAKNIKSLMEISFKYGKITKEDLDLGESESVVFFKDDPDHPQPRPAPRPPVTGVRIVGDDGPEPFKPID